MKTLVTIAVTVLMYTLLTDIHAHALGFGGMQGWIAVGLHGLSYAVVWAAALYIRR